MLLHKKFSQHKLHTHRALFLTQIISPILMFAGASLAIHGLIILGLVLLILANLIAAFTK